MSETPDFAALARQYLDLWEDQLAAMAADPTLAEQSARFFQSLGQSGAAANPLAAAQMATLAQQFMTLAGLSASGEAEHGDTPTGPTPTGAAGPAPTAAAPGDGVQQLAELASRLAAVEERLDRLEAGGGKPRRRTEPATGSRRKPATKRGGGRKPPKSTGR